MIQFPKLKFRKRQVKKALTILFYCLVAVFMVIGMVAPALSRI